MNNDHNLDNDDIELDCKKLNELYTNPQELEMNMVDLTVCADMIDDWVNGEPIDPHMCFFAAMLLNSIAAKSGIRSSMISERFARKVAEARVDYACDCKEDEE